MNRRAGLLTRSGNERSGALANGTACSVPSCCGSGEPRSWLGSWDAGSCHLQRLQRVAENAGAAAESGSFRLIQDKQDGGERAFAADEMRQCEGHPIAIRHAVKARANRQNGPLIVKQ